jgi:hypothetical protein
LKQTDLANKRKRNNTTGANNLTKNIYQQQRKALMVLSVWTLVANKPMVGTLNPFNVFFASSIMNPNGRKSKLGVLSLTLDKIGTVEVGSNYIQITGDEFPDAFNAAVTAKGKTAIPWAGDWYGVNMWHQSLINAQTGNLLQSNMYALFNKNPNGGDLKSSPSVVIKFTMTENELMMPSLTFMDYLYIGNNCNCICPYGNRLFACAQGGPIYDGTANPDSGIWEIDAANTDTETMTARELTIPQTSSGDYRSIGIIDDEHVYIVGGIFKNNYTMFSGKLYRTTLSNLLSLTPSAWTEVQMLNGPGYYWGNFADPVSGWVWIVKGETIEVYVSPIEPNASPLSIPDLTNMVLLDPDIPR